MQVEFLSRSVVAIHLVNYILIIAFDHVIGIVLYGKDYLFKLDNPYVSNVKAMRARFDNLKTVTISENLARYIIEEYFKEDDLPVLLKNINIVSNR